MVIQAKGKFPFMVGIYTGGDRCSVLTYQKLKKCKKIAFFKATTFIKHKNHNFDF